MFWIHKISLTQDKNIHFVKKIKKAVFFHKKGIFNMQGRSVLMIETLKIK